MNLDAATGGRLIPALRAWREAGYSWSTCSRKLHDEFGIDLADTTVRRGYLRLPEVVE